MKNQYFGDINDYRKYGLLRVLCHGENIRLGVCWMLTPNDKSTDGERRHHIDAPEKHRQCDEALFDALSTCKRHVSEMERLKILPKSTAYWPKLFSDQRSARKAYFQRMRRAFASVNLIFFDPDNGFEIKSRPYGRKLSSKYLYWEELVSWYEGGCSALVYQHFRREGRDTFINRIAAEIHKRTGANPIYSFRTAHVVFFLAPRPEHNEHFSKQLVRLQVWGGQITSLRHRF